MFFPKHVNAKRRDSKATSRRPGLACAAAFQDRRARDETRTQSQIRRSDAMLSRRDAIMLIGRDLVVSFAHLPTSPSRLLSLPLTMKITVKHWHAIAQWRWDTGSTDDDDGEGDVCGICRVAYESCCPSCKMPGDDCPLSAFSLRISENYV